MDEFPPDHPHDAPPPSEAAAMPPLPNEDPGVPWLKGLIDTVVLFTRKPGEAFARMSLTGGLMRPYVYALVTGSLGFLIGLSWQVLMLPLTQQWSPPGAAGASALPTGGMLFVIAACLPLLVAANIFVNALIFHVSLMVVGGRKRGLGATLRVVCYSYTALLAVALPLCGTLVATIWVIYLMLVGLAEAHGISKAKAAIATLLPSILACICVFLVMFMAFGGLMSSGVLPGIKP